MRPQKQQQICVTLVLAALAFLPIEAAKAQNVIHVPADQPTIQAAINAAANGDTVLVAPGTYRENINFMGKAITVTSSGGAQVTIVDGGGTGPVVTFASGETAASVLNGFTLTNGNAANTFPNSGGGIAIQGVSPTSPTITNNVISQNIACNGGGGIAISSGSPVIRANVIVGNAQATTCGGGIGGGGISIEGNPQILGNVIVGNSFPSSGGGIALFGGSPLIRSNLIVGNMSGTGAGGGISMVNQANANITQNLISGNSATQGGGIYWLVSFSGVGPLLVNNTIVDNDSASGSALFGDGFQSQVKVVNNLIIGKSGETAVFCGNFNNTIPPIFSFDDVNSLGGMSYAGICTDQTGKNGNISADPLFIDPLSSDYHLRVGSPAIDVGDNSAPNLPLTDIDGDNRIINATGKPTAIIDMGVDEFSNSQVLNLSNSRLNFGLQPVGTSSAAQSFTFANNGTTVANISAVIAGGDFSQTNNCGTSLVAGANCTITVIFKPTARGTRVGVAAVMTDASESPQAVLLSGTGTGPAVSLSNTSLFFTAQAVGTTSAAQPLVVTNSGDAPLTLSGIVANGDFGIGSSNISCSTSTPVGAGANCVIDVAFTPKAIGPRSGALTITDDAVGSPQTIPLNGLGSTPVAIAATAGTPQSAITDTAFMSPLVATVTDAGGKSVAGVTVTFTVPPSRASGTFAGGVTTAVTNNNGLAISATLTANAIAGSYTVAATAGAVGPVNFNLTNTIAPVAIITATSGTPQNAAINTGFSLPLVVTVKDGAGNPVSGVTVTFTAPASRVSGTFVGGLRANTAVTNASGVATSATFTASGFTGSYIVTATAGAIGPANFNLTNTAGAPATVAATGGTLQNAVVNTALASPLRATVRDASGNPVSGVTVTFTAPGSGASGTFAGGANTALTDANGVATSATFTANGTAGSYTVTATAGALGPANFSLTNTATAPATITATGGTPQNVVVNTAFALALQVTVKDSNGSPVAGVAVTFTDRKSAASGTFAGGLGVNTAVTNTGGVATSATFTANGFTGSYIVTATAGAIGPANFNLTNTAGAPATVAATGGTPQNVVVNTAFSLPLVARVLDVSGNPVPGVTVTFTAPGSGASGTFANGTAVTTAITNVSGAATVSTFTANGTASGPYNVVASVTGATSANFALTNTAGAPATITATGGTPQNVVVNTAFASALQVTVKDSNGSTVAGVTVTFTAPRSAASGTFAGELTGNIAVTNASGVATSAIFTANSNAGGPYTVTASVVGVATTASFSLTNTAGAPATITAIGGTPQIAAISTAFASPLQAAVKDASGNPVSGVTVTFTAPGSGASGTFAGGVNTAVTSASGVATCAVFTTNGTVGGPYSVTATVGAVGPTNFSLTNTATAPAKITALSGTPQNAEVNTAFASALQVTVKDSNGSPVAGVTVTFTTPKSAASGTFVGGVNTAVTNASGVATSATFTASATSGTYRVTATAGAIGPANFVLSNTPVSPPPSAPAFSPAMNFDTKGVSPNCVQAADLNGDGKLDLVITNMKTNNVSVLLGNGDGTFQPAVTYGLASGGLSFPGCAAVADFNNDGNPDIAVTDGLVGTSGGTISILINKGNGTFFPAVAVNSNISPLCLTAADLNKDGNQDLWVGGNGASAVLFGNGDGTFQTPQIYSIGLAGTGAVAVGDLNRDGSLDLVGVAVTGGGPPSQPPSVLGVLLNQGNGIVGPTSSGNAATLLYPVGSLGAGVVLGDFNHDGKLDAAVTNFASNDISILVGNGDGTFQPQSTFIAGNGPASLALGDFDGTGRMDLVVTTQDAAMNGNGVAVFLGNGDGTFKFYQGLATGSSPAYVTVGDFNGDGVPDIAVVDAATNVVSIILTQ
jgi:hypothetical protein